MENSRKLILQAEEQIQQFADQLFRAKQVVDGVEAIERLLKDAAQQIHAACQALEQAQQQVNNAVQQVQRVSQTSQEAISSAVALMSRLKDETSQSLNTLRAQLDHIEQATARQTKILYLAAALLLMVFLLGIAGLVLR